MSGSAGYVAADALAALAILGLATGGLTAGLYTLGRGEWATTSTLSQAVSLRAAEGELASLVQDRGPFRSDADSQAGLVGEAERLEFPCDGRRCIARLEPGRIVISDRLGTTRGVRLPGATSLRFSYVGSTATADHWPPPSAPPPAPRWQVLRAVVVETGLERRPLVVAQLQAQQVFDCEFDGIIQDCRTPAP